MLFYLLVLFVVLLISRKAQKTDNLLYVIAVAVIFSLTAGLRDVSVGIDTQSYCNIFEAIRLGDITLAWRGIENSFIEICKLLMLVNNDNAFLFCCFAALTNVLIITRLWDFKEIASFPLMIVSYYATFYFLTLNIVRQFCAIAIIFWGTRYLMRKKYFIYLICVIVAFLFHRSALVGLMFFIMEIGEWKKLKTKSRLFILIGFISIPVYASYIENNFSFYLKYFKVSNVNIGIMLPIKIILLIISFIEISRKFAQSNASQGSELVLNNIKIVKNYYLVGLILTFLGYIFSFMDRIGLVFYLFECVYWGAIFKKFEGKSIYKSSIVFILVYTILMEFIGNGQGALPYHFYWYNLID